MQRASLYRRRLPSASLSSLLIWLSLTLCTQSIQARSADAPYLEARSADGTLENLPLQSTHAEVQVIGALAEVRLVQVYGNRGDQPIEAIYRFPASSTAAVHAASMRVGERHIQAQIREKQAARAEYEAAKAAGRTAALLEQAHPSLFSLSLAQVMPGDRIEIELRYTELLVPEEGQYRFDLPNALQQRYGSPGVAAVSSDDAQVVDFAFDFDLRIDTPLPLAEFASDTHSLLEIDRHSHGGRWVLAPDDAKAIQRDLAFSYRLRGDAIGSGVIADPDANGQGGWFLLMMEPPARSDPAHVLPREYVFVVDVSGSMHGPPLELAKRMMRNLLAGLRPTDRFNVILFAGSASVFADGRSVAASPQAIDEAMQLIDRQAAGGGTELLPALERAYALEATPGMSRNVVVVSDGGIWSGASLWQTIRRRLDQANVFAFGVGGSINRDVITAIARAGLGEPFMIDNFAQGQARAQRFREYIEAPLLTDISVEGRGLELHDMEPDIIPDLMAQRPLMVLGRYRGDGNGEIAVSGLTAGKPYEQRLALRFPRSDENHQVIRRLWAQKRIARLRDEQDAAEGERAVHRAEITELALSHSLLSPYTAFIAIDSTVRNADPAAPLKPVLQPAAAMAGHGNALLSMGTLAMRAAPMAQGTPRHRYLPLRDALGVDPEPAAALNAKPGTSVALGGRLFRIAADGRWIDSAHTDSARLLRVRRGSAAFELLIRLAPELLPVLKRAGATVVLSFGNTSIQIGPSGFSDYPEDTLRAALAGGRT